uniref:Uncharacterized protein n=1 Tax=Nelumbo nucifera TaxID=4432 RepID=A0A822Z703_NELNU|nr:TPA_asm: hypothetical protein HUJ06_000384 [Nelumbo nucifera]
MNTLERTRRIFLGNQSRSMYDTCRILTGPGEFSILKAFTTLLRRIPHSLPSKRMRVGIL